MGTLMHLKLALRLCDLEDESYVMKSKCNIWTSRSYSLDLRIETMKQTMKRRPSRHEESPMAVQSAQKQRKKAS
jgi:hypothetical protein